MRQNLKVLARTGSSFVKRTTIFCLLIPLDDPSYKNIYQRLAKNNVQFHQLLENQPIQGQNSELCGLFCIVIAHLIFDDRQIVNCSDFHLIRFALHMML